jgi:UDP-N-acetylglucosamine:LPS N-acetylglucosamine transferase
MMGNVRGKSRLKQVLGAIFIVIAVVNSQALAAKDPHEPHAVMPAGRFKGQPIDASRRRPVTILPADQAAKYSPEPGDIVVANFFSEDRYWIAKIHKDSVGDVILQMEKFNPDRLLQLTPHTQFRFQLKPGKEIELFPQAGTRLPKNPKVGDVVITAWSASIEGHEFSVANVQRGDYIRYVRVMNSEDAFQNGVTRGKHEFPQIKLKLNDEKKSELFEEGVRISDQQGLGKMFNLTNSNCGTFVFCDLMQPVLEEELAGSSRPIFTYTGHLKKYLSRHGLVDLQTGGELPNWEKEWVDHIPPPKKKVIIFTSSNGGGHNASAEAIKKRILAMDPSVEVVIKDANELYVAGTGTARSKLNDAVYQKAPGVWDKLRSWQARNAEQVTDAADLPSYVSDKALLDYLKETNPDVVLTTYNGIVQNFARLRSKGLISIENFKIGWLLENFSDENLYLLKAKAIDMTWSPHSEITRSLIDKGVLSGQVETTGLPLNPKLFEEFPDASRRKFLKKALLTPDTQGEEGIWVNGLMQSVQDPNGIVLDPDVKTIFISSGKAGAGKFKTIVEGLIGNALKKNMRLQIVVGCGTNTKNYLKLTGIQVPDGITLVVSKLLENDKQIKYVRSADLNIGKSGSQGPSEFVIGGRPRILVNSVGGQETINGRFFQNQGLAELVSGDQQEMVADVAFELLGNPEKLEAMHLADEEFLKSIHPELIDRWVGESLTDSARVQRTPITGEISNFENLKANLLKIPQTLGLSWGQFSRLFVEENTVCDETLMPKP